MADRPPAADFAVVIDFDKAARNPQRIFQTADAIITAFQKFDESLVRSVDASIEPTTVLEDVEAGSLKIWLRTVLEASDDQAIKELDWRPQVGKYLVKAKYILLDFINQRIEATDAKGLAQLRSDLNKLAEDTDVRHLPDYAPISSADLISTVSSVSSAKGKLAKTDRLTLISNEGEATFDLEVEWSPEKMEDLFIKETIKHPPSQMILLVKRPDYIGETQWEFRHSRTTIRAKIADVLWLRGFQSRSFDVRPGDALRCLVEREVQYGYDNEVIGEKFTVTKVESVIESREEQIDFLRDD